MRNTLAFDVYGTLIDTNGVIIALQNIVGERAALEEGIRTSTVRAVTPVTYAAVPPDALPVEDLREVAAGHRREG